MMGYTNQYIGLLANYRPVCIMTPSGPTQTHHWAAWKMT